MKRILVALAPLLALAVPSSAQFPLDVFPFPPTPENCSWALPPVPTTLLSFGPTWQVGDTKYRNVTEEWSGVIICRQTEVETVCEETFEPGRIWVISSVPVLVIGVSGGGWVYSEEEISVTTTTFSAYSVTHTRTHAWSCPPPVEPGQELEVDVELTLDSSWVHDVADATYASFEGEELILGQEIPLSQFGPGTYTYYVERSNGIDTSTLTVAITVVVSNEFTLEQVDSLPTDYVLPTAVFEFTNDADWGVDLHLEAVSQTPSLEAHLSFNQVHVPAGATVRREVRFTTTATTAETHAIPEGATFSALVNAYSVSPHNTLLASTEVWAATCAPTLGHGEDLRMRTEVNGGGLPSLCAKRADVGDLYTVSVDSPGGTFAGVPAIVYYDSFALGSAFQRLYPTLPEFHLSATHQTLTTTGSLPAGGLSLSGPMPPAMAGLVVRVQAAAISPLAANGTFALSDAHDLNVF